MTSSKPRAAVIGLGRHGLRHLEAYSCIENVEIAAVCDVHSGQVVAALNQYPAAKGYEDWQKLLREERLDVVSVVTNGPTHAPITIAAAQAGVGRVVCEKPMATSLGDAQAMIRVCQQQGTRLSISHGRRWVRSYQQLRELIGEGRIGKIAHFWFTCGGGLFAGNGMHMLDLARMLSQANPVSVVAIVDQTGTPNPRGSEFQDPGAVALYQFDNGMRLVIDMFEDLGIPPRIEIVGSLGRILIDEVDGRWEIAARDETDGDKPVAHYWLPLRPVPFQPGPLDMVKMLEDGLNELLSNNELSCTGADGLTALEMVIGAHVSQRKGTIPIKLPLASEFRDLSIALT